MAVTLPSPAGTGVQGISVSGIGVSGIVGTTSGGHTRGVIAHNQAGGIDTVGLACTQFPLLADELTAAFPDVAYVDGGAGIAHRIAYLTRDQAWPASPSPGLMLFTSSARTPSLSALANFGIGDTKIL